MIDTAPDIRRESSLVLWYLRSKAFSAFPNLAARPVSPKSQKYLKAALIHLTDLKQVEARHSGDVEIWKGTCLQWRHGEGIRQEALQLAYIQGAM